MKRNIVWGIFLANLVILVPYKFFPIVLQNRLALNYIEETESTRYYVPIALDDEHPCNISTVNQVMLLADMYFFTNSNIGRRIIIRGIANCLQNNNIEQYFLDNAQSLCNDQDPYVLITCGEIYWILNDTQRAFIYWQQIPDYDSFLVLQGHKAYQLSNNGLAIYIYKIANMVNPQPQKTKVEMYRDLCHLALSKNDLDQALEWCQILVEQDPLSPAYLLLGRVYYERGEYIKAQNAFTESIRLDSSKASPYFWLGMTYWQTENIDNAEKQFRLAINVQPNYPYPHLYLARLLIDRGDIESATQELNFVIQLGAPDTLLEETKKLLSDITE